MGFLDERWVCRCDSRKTKFLSLQVGNAIFFGETVYNEFINSNLKVNEIERIKAIIEVVQIKYMLSIARWR